MKIFQKLGALLASMKSKPQPKAPLPKAQTQKVYPLLPRRVCRPVAAPCHSNGGKTPRTKGRRDASLKSRSNRRKAAR